MPTYYAPTPPDGQEVRLRIMDGQVDLTQWTSYDFSSDFLTPSDSFSFQLGSEGLAEKQRAGLRLGARVRIYIDSITLAEGFIDSIEISATRGAGVVYNIRGRDRLGQALDTCVDPAFQLKEGGTLADLVRRLYAPLGFVADEHFVVDPSANRDARSGIRGVPTAKTKKAKAAASAVDLRRVVPAGHVIIQDPNVRELPGTNIKPLKSFVLHQLKPYNHESVYAFSARVAQRHGLWIRVSADGEQLILAKPDYAQEPAFILHRSRTGTGNVIDGTVRYEMTDQPTMIIADGFSGGAEFGKSRIKAFIVNPLLGLTDEGEYTDEVKGVLEKHPRAVENTLPAAAFPFRAADIPFRPMYLHDDESKTQEQLNNFVKREMSLRYRKSLHASYTVEGHGQTVNDRFITWVPDTVVEVIDEVAELRERMYVLGTHWTKSRGGSGTTTKIDLVRLNALVL